MSDAAVMVLFYILVLLVPLNWYIYAAALRERERTQRIVRGYWKLYRKRNGGDK